MVPDFMAPQSRAVMRLLGRNYDGFTDGAQRQLNWLMLAVDALLAALLLSLL